ncbi:hypothetical protein [Aliiglaciecola lipolytica]|uniref:Uncharacterized protein n=1 Tax=Aliiglaciecola lipolytica E3 TaxID=1127673 RepID=K6YX12_9ALTE|nr:hypothetical protein [Aliiglaciecola lipolytica]GAC15765.1 hypothetical protein GLIP_3144 [Aliiglaciecola lipolytica E3]
MNLVNFTKHFSEKNQGSHRDTFVLSSVVHPLREPPLSDQDRDNFAHLISMTKKDAISTCGLLSTSDLNQGLWLANLAEKTQKNVLLLTSTFINNISKTYLAELYANIHRYNALVFFAQADALVEGNCSYADTSEQIDLDLLFKIINGASCLTIFALHEQQNALRLKARQVTVISL